MSKFFKRGCIFVVSLSMVSLGVPTLTYADIVGTPAVVAAGQRDANLAAVRAGLERSDVRDRMVAMGVAPEAVDARLAMLSDAELQRMANDMNELPAGSGVLAVIGVVFVVLMVLELTGVIDIFKKR